MTTFGDFPAPAQQLPPTCRVTQVNIVRTDSQTGHISLTFGSVAESSWGALSNNELDTQTPERVREDPTGG